MHGTKLLGIIQEKATATEAGTVTVNEVTTAVKRVSSARNNVIRTAKTAKRVVNFDVTSINFKPKKAASILPNPAKKRPKKAPMNPPIALDVIDGKSLTKYPT